MRAVRACRAGLAVALVVVAVMPTSAFAQEGG